MIIQLSLLGWAYALKEVRQLTSQHTHMRVYSVHVSLMVIVTAACLQLLHRIA